MHTFNLWNLSNFYIASGVQQDTKMQIANAQKKWSLFFYTSKIAICIFFTICFWNILHFTRFQCCKITIVFVKWVLLPGTFKMAKMLPVADGKRNSRWFFCHIKFRQSRKNRLLCSANWMAHQPPHIWSSWMSDAKKMRAYSLPKVSIAMFLCREFS